MEEMDVQFIMIYFTISLITAAVSVSLVPEQVQALITTNQIGDGAVTTSKLANGAVTTSKLANGAVTTPTLSDHSVTASKISGLTKLIFATCNTNFGSINPHSDGLADCSVPGTATGDNVVATPNNNQSDVMSFFSAVTLDGKVRFLIHNNSDIPTPAIPSTWSVIVFHK